MFEGLKIVEIVTQGGAVALSGLLIFVLYKIITNHTAHTNRVIGENNKALIRNAEEHAKHSIILEHLIRLLERKL